MGQVPRSRTGRIASRRAGVRRPSGCRLGPEQYAGAGSAKGHQRAGGPVADGLAEQLAVVRAYGQLSIGDRGDDATVHDADEVAVSQLRGEARPFVTRSRHDGATRPARLHAGLCLGKHQRATYRLVQSVGESPAGRRVLLP
jgi:hypothetical protein